MHGYTLREIIDSLPVEKRKSDGTVTRFLYRPLSFPLALFFLKLRWSPNGVTWFSIVVSLGAFACTLLPSMEWHVAGVLLYFLFGTLDCVDGNMARVLRGRNASGTAPAWAGEWADALGGYVTYACILLSMGMSSMLLASDGYGLPYGGALWLLLGAMGCAGNLVMRLAFQSWRVASGETSRASVGSEKRFSEEIGITGWFQPLYLAGLLLGFLPWVLAFYSLLYLGGCAFTVLKLILRVSRNSR